MVEVEIVLVVTEGVYLESLAHVHERMSWGAWNIRESRTLNFVACGQETEEDEDLGYQVMSAMVILICIYSSHTAIAVAGMVE